MKYDHIRVEKLLSSLKQAKAQLERLRSLSREEFLADPDKITRRCRSCDHRERGTGNEAGPKGRRGCYPARWHIESVVDYEVDTLTFSI